VSERRRRWDASEVRRLRQDLGLTQQALAAELGVRQQTVSEWETGMYAPRGASARLLDIVAERAGVAYGASPAEPPGDDAATGPADASNNPP
jgi:DNA-binding transcriptional regulator YiaG